MTKRIIVADDDASIIAALHMMLKSQGFDVSAVTTPEALIERVSVEQFSLGLIDLNYKNDTTSGKEGLALIKKMREIDADLPIVVMTGYSSVEIAVEAMKLGASDFVQKPWGNERLLQIISTQLELNEQKRKSAKLAHENVLLKQELGTANCSIVAESESMKTLLSQLEKLAKSDMSILFTGENGTGKSMFAQYVHEHSLRHEQAFIAVNMGAISDTLFESEMFGHVKGAFTDAKDNRIGRFELAQLGSIFLDEIANIAMPLQAKLLRVLEERQFEKVGSNKTQKVDLRLISATNADIASLIEHGYFRQDLLYRLNTVSVHIPALRERKEDVLPLANAFLTQYANKYSLPLGTFAPCAENALLSYSWPGNVRELAHVIERAMFLRSGEQVLAKDLNLPNGQMKATSDNTTSENKKGLRNVQNEVVGELADSSATLDEIEKQVIQERLTRFDNNPLKTAESLGLSRSAYYRRLEKYHLLESQQSNTSSL